MNKVFRWPQWLRGRSTEASAPKPDEIVTRLNERFKPVGQWIGVEIEKNAFVDVTGTPWHRLYYRQRIGNRVRRMLIQSFSSDRRNILGTLEPKVRQQYDLLSKRQPAEDMEWYGVGPDANTKAILDRVKALPVENRAHQLWRLVRREFGEKDNTYYNFDKDYIVGLARAAKEVLIGKETLSNVTRGRLEGTIESCMYILEKDRRMQTRQPMTIRELVREFLERPMGQEMDRLNADGTFKLWPEERRRVIERREVAIEELAKFQAGMQQFNDGLGHPVGFGPPTPEDIKRAGSGELDPGAHAAAQDQILELRRLWDTVIHCNRRLGRAEDDLSSISE